MAQNYTKDELHREMRQIHDEIKKHPFRVGFETQYIPEYKHLLYELSRKWSDLIWHCSELTDEETRLYRQFGGPLDFTQRFLIEFRCDMSGLSLEQRRQLTDGYNRR